MPKMIPNVSIGVSRKRGSRNVTIFPAIGEMFDFTEEEIKQVKAEHPNGLRRPINETETASTEEPEEVTSEEEGAEEKEETSQTQYTGRLTPQQQRQRDAQAQREARRAGRRTHSEDDL